MNPSINALMTKLNWQENELHQLWHNAQIQVHLIKQQVLELEQEIEHSGISSAVINPEVEINRLNYMTQKQEQKAIVVKRLHEQQILENNLKDKLQRIKTELKMLEKYMQRQELGEKEKLTKFQENALDEWVLQKRE